jgi:hypothetical protein
MEMKEKGTDCKERMEVIKKAERIGRGDERVGKIEKSK